MFREIQAITMDVARETVPYAMMASNSYHKADRVRFDVESLGWISLPDATGPRHPLSHLAYDVYENVNTRGLVVAFRGTESIISYFTANLAIPPFHFQYLQARREFEAIQSKYPDRKIIVTGHSLGGGLALSMSVHFGVPAFAFDSSPRIFDGWGDHRKDARRSIIFQKGEILNRIRPLWFKVWEVVKLHETYQCNFPFPTGVSKHRADYLALGLLRMASSNDRPLTEVLLKAEAFHPGQR